MPDRALVRKNVEQYETLGFAGPIKAFDPEELGGVAHAVLQELKTKNFSLHAKRNRHLDWDVAERLTSAKPIAEFARAILGPRLVLWRTNFFIGYPGVGLSWHQDQYQTLLSDTANHLSIHLAITQAPSDNCVMVIPGSHLLTRAQLADQGFNFVPGTDKNAYGAPSFWRDSAHPLNRVKMTLLPGEFFAFHPRLLHASIDRTSPLKPKPSAHKSQERPMPRIGLGFRITVPENQVLPAAFSETNGRGDHCVML